MQPWSGSPGGPPGLLLLQQLPQLFWGRGNRRDARPPTRKCSWQVGKGWQKLGELSFVCKDEYFPVLKYPTFTRKL